MSLWNINIYIIQLVVCKRFIHRTVITSDIQYPSTDEENVFTAVKSPLSQLQLPSVGLSVTAASTEEVISGGPVKLNEQVRTTYSTPSPLRKST